MFDEDYAGEAGVNRFQFETQGFLPTNFLKIKNFDKNKVTKQENISDA